VGSFLGVWRSYIPCVWRLDLLENKRKSGCSVHLICHLQHCFHQPLDGHGAVSAIKTIALYLCVFVIPRSRVLPIPTNQLTGWKKLEKVCRESLWFCFNAELWKQNISFADVARFSKRELLTDEYAWPVSFHTINPWDSYLKVCS